MRWGVVHQRFKLESMYHLTKGSDTCDVYVICCALGLGKLEVRVTLMELTPSAASHP
jgi:hypothetical protein